MLLLDIINILHVLRRSNKTLISYFSLDKTRYECFDVLEVLLICCNNVLLQVFEKFLMKVVSVSAEVYQVLQDTSVEIHLHTDLASNLNPQYYNLNPFYEHQQFLALNKVFLL